jgi:hypothetical protein
LAADRTAFADQQSIPVPGQHTVGTAVTFQMGAQGATTETGSGPREYHPGFFVFEKHQPITICRVRKGKG